MSTFTFADRKYVNRKFAEDYNFEPVLTDIRDESIAGFHGHYIHRVKCTICGKVYELNQSIRIRRHHVTNHVRNQ